MTQTVSCLTLDDNKEYIVLEKMQINNQDFLILFECDNPKNVCVAQYLLDKDGSSVSIITDTKIVHQILNEFFIKHPQFKI